MFKTPSKDKNDGKQLAEEKQVAVQRKSDEFYQYRTGTAHYSPHPQDMTSLDFDQNLEISEFPQNMRETKSSAHHYPNVFKLI